MSSFQLPKRQQVAFACTSCVLKKRKCDENRPCERCVKHGWACVDKPRNGVALESFHGAAVGGQGNMGHGHAHDGGVPIRTHRTLSYEWSPEVLPAVQCTEAAIPWIQFGSVTSKVMDDGMDCAHPAALLLGLVWTNDVWRNPEWKEHLRAIVRSVAIPNHTPSAPSTQLQSVYTSLLNAEVWKSVIPTCRITFNPSNHLPTSLAVSQTFLHLFHLSIDAFVQLIRRQSALGFVYHENVLNRAMTYASALSARQPWFVFPCQYVRPAPYTRHATLTIFPATEVVTVEYSPAGAPIAMTIRVMPPELDSALQSPQLSLPPQSLPQPPVTFAQAITTPVTLAVTNTTTPSSSSPTSSLMPTRYDHAPVTTVHTGISIGTATATAITDVSGYAVPMSMRPPVVSPLAQHQQHHHQAASQFEQLAQTAGMQGYMYTGEIVTEGGSLYTPMHMPMHHDTATTHKPQQQQQPHKYSQSVATPPSIPLPLSKGYGSTTDGYINAMTSTPTSQYVGAGYHTLSMSTTQSVMPPHPSNMNMNNGVAVYTPQSQYDWSAGIQLPPSMLPMSYPHSHSHAHYTPHIHTSTALTMSFPQQYHDSAPMTLQPHTEPSSEFTHTEHRVTTTPVSNATTITLPDTPTPHPSDGDRDIAHEAKRPKTS